MSRLGTEVADIYSNLQHRAAYRPPRKNGLMNGHSLHIQVSELPPEQDSFELPVKMHSFSELEQASLLLGIVEDGAEKGTAGSVLSAGNGSPPDSNGADQSKRSRRSSSKLGDFLSGEEEGVKERHKVGRPIAYRGDPNAATLTEQERRKIKRQISNRESARRVRQSRQKYVEELQLELEQSKSREKAMQSHVNQIDKEYAALYNQLCRTHAKLQQNIRN